MWLKNRKHIAAKKQFICNSYLANNTSSLYMRQCWRVQKCRGHWGGFCLFVDNLINNVLGRSNSWQLHPYSLALLSAMLRFPLESVSNIWKLTPHLFSWSKVSQQSSTFVEFRCKTFLYLFPGWRFCHWSLTYHKLRPLLVISFFRERSFCASGWNPRGNDKMLISQLVCFGCCSRFTHTAFNAVKVC